jgi:hypothetical protein
MAHPTHSPRGDGGAAPVPVRLPFAYLPGPEPVDWARRVSEFVALVSGGHPHESGYLTAIHEGQVFLSGTSAALVGSRLTRLPSGLWVPAAADLDPGPADTALVYLTWSELSGATASAEEISRLIADTSVVEAVLFCSRWLGRLHAPEANRQTVDEQFIEEHFRPALAVRARNLRRQRRRILLAEQSLFMLLKLAFELAPLQPLHDRPLRIENLVLATLALADHLGTDDYPGAGDGDIGALGREFLRNQAFNYRADVASLLASFRRACVELPDELAVHPKVVNFGALYEQATGVPLRDINAMAFLLWAVATQSGPVISTVDLPDAIGWDPERVDRTLRLMALTSEALRAGLIRENAEYGLEWANNTFTHRPVVQGSGAVVVIDPYLALQRGFSWRLLVADIEQAGRGKLARKARQCMDHVTEAMAVESVKAIVGDSAVSRLYLDEDLAKAYKVGKVTPSHADAAIDYGTAWIVCEVTTMRLNRKTLAGGDDRAIREDFDKYRDKIQQLDSTINLIRSHPEKLTGPVESRVAPRFRPVLILDDGFPVNPASLELLRDAARRANLLTGPDVAALEVLGLDELSLVEAIQAEGGPSFLDLLDQKEASNLRNMSLRHFIHFQLRLEPGRTARVAARYRAAFRQAATDNGLDADSLKLN